MKKIYLDCDLFTEGQRWQAKEIQKALEKEFETVFKNKEDLIKRIIRED